MTRRDPDAGFTLIEVLVAMAVLASGAVALLTAAERHSALARDLADRTVARWAASNRLVEFTLGLEPEAAPVILLGMTWRVSSDIVPTSDPDLMRVDITAEKDGSTKPSGAVTLTGFVDAAVLKER